MSDEAPGFEGMKSRGIMDVWKAMKQVQEEIPKFFKSAENPHFKSKYVDLPTILEALLPICRKNGLLVTQAPVETREGTIGLKTRIVHVETGQEYCETIAVPLDKATAQAAGSAITYMRRYALTSMFALIADDDDDGNAASSKDKKEVKAKVAEPVVIKTVKAKAAEKNYDLDAFCAKRGYASIEEITSDDAAGLLNHLKTL